MANFREVQFPTGYILSGTGGQRFSTTVIGAKSGYEQRNINWQQSRGQWNIGFPLRTSVEFERLIAFHRNCYGMGYGFRFKDPADFSATMQEIGTGNGSNKTFQLVKTYTSGTDVYTRTIKKPVTSSVLDNDGNALSNTVHVYFGTGSPVVFVEQVSGWTIDHTTGIVTFTSAPAGGTVVAATFQFDVPVRFDADDLNALYASPNRTSWPTFPIVEVRI